MSELPSAQRRWWMFLPLILCLAVIFYFSRKEKSEPRPGYIAAENNSSHDVWREISVPLQKEVVEKHEQPAGVEQVLEEYGFMKNDRLLELLAVRLISPDERLKLLKLLVSEDDELFRQTPPFTDQQLKKRQDMWIRSGHITPETQRQMLHEDKLMQYAAMELIIREKMAKITEDTSGADKLALVSLLRIQAAIR